MLPILNKTLIQSNANSNVSQDVFSFPETILQFGTGVLLRGLVDYLVDKGNRKNLYQGRIVVIKSTDGSTSDFSSQDSLFTTHIKGVAQGELVDNVLINSSISRVLQSNAEWSEILACVHQPALKTIISNTTEVGIQYSAEKINTGVPTSFPGKLLAILWERFNHFKGDSSAGFVIVPTELIVNNGNLLKEIIIKLANFNELPDNFIQWINTANRFCNSLVDRIVPGKPRNLADSEAKAGYTDQLWIEVEPFLLWAIEGDEYVKSVLSFHQADERMLIESDITPFREQKLRLLNGSHTAAVPLGFLSGLNTVYECMSDPYMNGFFKKVVLEEILPTIQDDCPTATAFANDVLDRFANPFIEHKLISITFQESSKMNARNVKTLLRYQQKFNKLPENICLGFAAMLLFLRPAGINKDGKYYGNREAGEYVITDDNAAIFADYWQNETDINSLVNKIASDTRLWETDLSVIPGFVSKVSMFLSALKDNGVSAFIKSQNL
ncbi:tagaturonate reductase [Chitinophaga silvatica]|uniref:Tagaturonate reductase n=1 Tax=Chitinophaga silvatica TaxID=2282649 RepID=A0A3E1YDS0_9BACT|nr:tagaturonate reductase [Chitinophaga silvatica]RFS24672.1 tagaturonate reductase [Chitinophaga silvatica]